MTVEFQHVNERVMLHKYTEPIREDDFVATLAQFHAFAETTMRTVFLIADFTEVYRFPPYMLSLGLRTGQTNPVRNPKLEHIVVIAHMPLIMSLTSMLVKITGITKFSIVRTRAQAEEEIQALNYSSVP